MPIDLEADREGNVTISPRATGGSTSAPGRRDIRTAALTHETATARLAEDFEPSRSQLPGGTSADADPAGGMSSAAGPPDDDSARHGSARERALEEMVRDADIRMLEMRHRIANSLQIIGSILRTKARSAGSEEARGHLQDVHHRLMAVAAVQEQLNGRHAGEAVPIGPYFRQLCHDVAQSTVGDGGTVAVTVNAPDRVAPASFVTSLGLVVTELLMNAVKHAFPDGIADRRVEVAFRGDVGDWSLDVSDNGVGLQDGSDGMIGRGLGTRVVELLARRLDARIEVSSDRRGTRIVLRRSA